MAFTPPGSLTNAPVLNVGDSTVPGTVTGAAHAETLNVQCGTVTTEALSTAAAGTETRTLTNSAISAGSRVFVFITGGTNTTQGIIASAVAGAGSATIKFYNANAGAVNGTLVYTFLVL